MASEGMCVVITGSASGLGAATAARLAKGGARIVINYASSQKEAEQTADLCRTAGAEVVVVQGDVSRDEDCKKIAAAAAPWGRLDALINNAGTTKHMAHGNLDGLSAEDFQRLFGVNTIGPFQMVRAARALLEAGAKASGRASAVVNVSSVAGISGIGSSIAYAASKGALNTITYSLARALAPLIRVNTVCPGYIDTPWFTKGRGEEAAKPVRDNATARVPIKVARNAPAIPSTVVKINPLGLFGPGDSNRAMIPATKPTMITQRMPLMTVVLSSKPTLKSLSGCAHKRPAISLSVGSRPSGVKWLTMSGKCRLSPASNSSRDRPLCAESALS